MKSHKELNMEFNADALGIPLSMFKRLKPLPTKAEIDKCITMLNEYRTYRESLIGDRIQYE